MNLSLSVSSRRGGVVRLLAVLALPAILASCADSGSSGSSVSATPAAPAPPSGNPATGAAPSLGAAEADAWPAYRGQKGDGFSPSTGLLNEWPAGGPPLVFKQPIGAGYSSFAIAGGRAYTLEEEGDRAQAVCFSLKDGARLWTFPCDAAFSAFVPPDMRGTDELGTDGPRSTPAYHDGRVYVLGAHGGFHCLDAATGKAVWSADLLRDSGEGDPLQWGFVSSPLVHGGSVYVTAPGVKKESLLCYDAATGRKKWAVLRQEQAYSSPMIATIGGQEQILNLSLSKLNAVDPADGALLWSSDFKGNSFGSTNCSQPLLLGEDRILLSSGWGKGAAVIDIAADAEGKPRARTLWANLSLKAKFNPPVLAGGLVYGLDEGILVCLDPADGKRRWKGGRYGYGQVIHADGKLIVLSEKGELVLLKLDPIPVEVSKFQALEGTCWSSPAIAAGLLLARNKTQIACFDLRAEAK